MRKALCAVLALALTAAACGTDDNSTGVAQAPPSSCAAGAISGAGSTFVATIAQQWIKDYSATCMNASVNYQAVGSGAGVQQLTSGTVDFAASDVPLKPDEMAAATTARGEILQIPWAAGGIAVQYKLEGVKDLSLSPQTLAGIFAGRIARWNDPAIAAENPDARLRDRAIQVFHRSDGSGTTAAFTEYMSQTASDVWTVGSGKEVDWPVGQGVKGSDGVTSGVKTTEGAIGYAEVSYALANSLSVAKVRNASGAFTTPNAQSVTAALDAASIDDKGVVELDYAAPAPQTYPVSTVTYLIVPRNQVDTVKAKLMRSFAEYAVSNGQGSAQRLAFAPLSQRLVASGTAQAAMIGG